MGHGKWLRNIIFTAFIGSLIFQSCKKENGIDNNNVIRTPYSLYFSDSKGALYNTNDGKLFKTIFPFDGYSQRAIVTSGTNVLFVKRNTHLSLDNGENFNPTEYTADPLSMWQSIILDVPNQDRLYLCSTRGLGIIYSGDHGKTWTEDYAWDPNIPGPVSGANTLAQLKGGDLFAFTNTDQRLFKRTSKTANWVEVLTTGLPAHTYFFSRLNDALLATDISGAEGVFFSNDRGVNWQAYTGLPSAVPIYATYAAFDQTLLVGTAGAGIYRLVSGKFIASNNGLEPSTAVYSIIAKADTYKNEVVKQYIYIGTNTGLYRSEDNGQNWIQMIPGDIRRVY